MEKDHLNSIAQYVKEVGAIYIRGKATEHSYRPALQQLFKSMMPEYDVTNEGRRVSCGAPDFIIDKDSIPIGYAEAKDIGTNLDKEEKSEQLKQRYIPNLNNLIFTDYLEFRFFKEGEKTAAVKLAEIKKGKIRAIKENFEIFENYIKDFAAFTGQTIKSSERLAEMMARKAKILEDSIIKALENDEGRESADEDGLKNQLDAFRKILIHDLTHETFADIYAQTISYGLFAARLHDRTLESFSRYEALGLVPQSNPFLKKLFSWISSVELDEGIKWIIDDLCEIFRSTNVTELMKDFGAATAQTDPFVHFYETFLTKFDKNTRKNRGVYYTPQPAVEFIVRCVDSILKADFNLSDGLASKEKTKIEYETDTPDGRTTGGYAKETKDVHKLQILDPATGTGTFLAEIVKHIHKRFENQQGAWTKYVEEHLLPRLNGFEILMAPYTMCHVKLKMILEETGYSLRKKRMRVYLTNSLEEAHPDTGTIFASFLANEANAANFIKKHTPVMVVIGNPPYANYGQMNQNDWILGLIDDYKTGLSEKKINLDDDYIKFIRYGEHYIERTGKGILAYISNNSFLDGITHRQMRKHLLQTFDTIYILDLHGSTKKLETAPDGGKDENVFDIQQGVSINIFVKTGMKNKTALGKVFHKDLYGRRKDKYDYLSNETIDSVDWTELKFDEEYFFFVPKDFSLRKKYEKGFSVKDLFINYNSGIETQRDKITIHHSKETLEKVLKDFKEIKDVEEIRDKYDLPKDGRDWKVKLAKQDVLLSNMQIVDIAYRPFDLRKTMFSGKSKGFIAYPGTKTMRHLLKDNLGLIVKRGFTELRSAFAFVTKHIIDRRVWSRPGMQGAESIFPLYLYPESGEKNLDGNTDRRPNFNMEIVKGLAEKLGLEFEAEKTPSRPSLKGKEQESSSNDPSEGLGGLGHKAFAPIDLLDYIYAVLHSPNYREKYKEFLKIDFPRVPYPKDAKEFWGLAEKGGELRELHLLESVKLNDFITSFPIEGGNTVGKLKYKDGCVYINDTQYFGGVPETAWNFYIGGYQPAQKWLKDRKGRALSYDDIEHYQKIISALMETDRIMKEIDKLKSF